MSAREASMQETLNEDDYEELWTVVTISKREYPLSKNQARLVQEAMARGDRGAIVFQTFTIPIPYVTDFYRERRFLKNTKALPEQTREAEYKRMSEEKWKKYREDIYKILGKPMLQQKKL